MKKKLLNNLKISLEAKELYEYFQSRPQGWKFSISKIASQLNEKEKTIQKAIKELERNGYLIKRGSDIFI